MAGENNAADLPVRLPDPVRYSSLSPIGEGGMGLVYRARDTILARDVAIKTLRTYAPDEVYQLKKEFRSLSQLSHPNLVQLYDLVVLDDQCFFTMELIEGVDLIRHIRHGDGAATPARNGSIDANGVRAAFYQLATGLHALHGFGKIHRDVKPANILVERDGRVVLLDFGLASKLLSRDSHNSRVGNLAGTLAYMSPEQTTGDEVSAASDWYSVGLILYEALTGKLPFEGPAVVSALARTRTTPRPPSALVPDAPADLNALTMALLRTAPGERPSGPEILERLQPPRSPHAVEPVTPPTPSDDSRFVGREQELAELRGALDATRNHGLVTVCISGPSGIGKTTLVERFVAATASATPDAVLLKARCHPQESIPFKAVDGAIDDLTRFLSHQPDARVEALLPRDIAALARVFPVLGRVKAIAAATEHAESSPEPQEIRRRAFAALRDLLARIGDRHPLLLWVDDFQWGDLDSVALLRTLRAPLDSPRVLVVLSFRHGDRETTALPQLFDDAGTDADAALPPARIELTPLTRHDAHELARQVIRLEGSDASEVEVAAIAQEGGGSPFFTCELARYLSRQRSLKPDADANISLRISGLVAQRVADLPDLDRRVLELVAVAGEPIQEELLHRVIAGGEDLARIISRLRSEHLLRPALVDDRPAIDTYHDRVREAVVQRLATETYRTLHGELAAALKSLPDPDPQRLVEHYFQANDLARAGEQAFASAERAAEALAFEQAARLYRRAMELGTTTCPAWMLQARLAATLVNMGRSGDAAALFGAAARALAATDPNHREVSRLERQAAEHYLRCGKHDEGLAVLRQVLAHAGLRYSTSPGRVIASLIVNRARLSLLHALPARRTAQPPSVRDQERLEVCWSAGLGLGVSDTLRAADFQVRHALMAQRSGDPAHLARALAIEALLMVWEGGERKRRRAARLRVESERLARAAGNPSIEAYSLVLRAVGAFIERRMREAGELAERAEALCRDKCVGVAWELANVQNIAVTARLFRGELPGLRRHVESLVREARGREDQYALLMCRLGYANMAWLAAGDPDEARRQADAGLAEPYPATFTWPVYQGALAQTHIDLYLGDGCAGFTRMEAAWQALNAGGMLRLQAVRVEMRELRARCAVNVAAGAGCDADERQRMLRFARREIKRIVAEDVPWSLPFVDALRASVAASSGDTRTARESLERAAFGFEHLELGLHAAAIRTRLAHLAGGGEGSRRAAEQHAWLLERGVQDPARMVALLSPELPVA